MKVKVSVVLPVCNVEKYLRQCLDSVIGQTLKEIEIIAVDDGSTDGSPAILDEYAAREPRMKVIHQCNAGAGAARNAGLDAANGDFVIFLDPDDYVDKAMLCSMYELAVVENADVVCSAWIVHDEAAGSCFRRSYGGDVVKWRGAKPPAELGVRLFTTFGFVPWNKLVRRAFLSEKGIRFQEIPRTNDVYFSTACVALAERIAVVNAAYYHYRQQRQGGLVSGIDKTPLSLIDALSELKAKLVREGVWSATVKTAFRIMAARECIVKVSVFRSIEAVREFYGKMQAEILDRLELRGLTEEQIGGELFPAYRVMTEGAPADVFLRELLYVFRVRYEKMKGRFQNQLDENGRLRRGGMVRRALRRLLGGLW